MKSFNYVRIIRNYTASSLLFDCLIALQKGSELFDCAVFQPFTVGYPQIFPFGPIKLQKNV